MTSDHLNAMSFIRDKSQDCTQWAKAKRKQVAIECLADLGYDWETDFAGLPDDPNRALDWLLCGIYPNAEVMQIDPNSEEGRRVAQVVACSCEPHTVSTQELIQAFNDSVRQLEQNAKKEKPKGAFWKGVYGKR